MNCWGIGRIWQTLIHFQQECYYQILGQCDRLSDCTAFVEFMLHNMAEALREGIAAPTIMSEKETAILELLTVQPQMTAAMLASVLGVTSRTVERYLRNLQPKGKLKPLGARKGGSWQVIA